MLNYVHYEVYTYFRLNVIYNSAMKACHLLSSVDKWEKSIMLNEFVFFSSYCRFWLASRQSEARISWHVSTVTTIWNRTVSLFYDGIKLHFVLSHDVTLNYCLSCLHLSAEDYHSCSCLALFLTAALPIYQKHSTKNRNWNMITIFCRNWPTVKIVEPNHKH